MRRACAMCLADLSKMLKTKVFSRASSRVSRILPPFIFGCLWCYFCSAGLSRSGEAAGTINGVVGNYFVQEILRTVEGHVLGALNIL